MADPRALTRWPRPGSAIPPASPTRRTRDGWAADRLDALISDIPKRRGASSTRSGAWQQSDRVLANLAGGPVEDLLARHGEAFIDRIYLLARREPVFRQMLGAVWRNSISDPVWQKLKSIAGPTF